MDKDNLKQWVHDFTDDLYRWALYRTSSEETAKDVVQETFLAASEKIHDFKRQSSPKTWLFSILNHKILDVYRKKAKKPFQSYNPDFSRFYDDEGSWLKSARPQPWKDDTPHLLDEDNFQEVLRKCLSVLPEKWHACIKLKYIMNKKGKDICQELEITPTNFWQIMHRAKLNLRECLERNWFQDE